LHAIAKIYNVDYTMLMEVAGYLTKKETTNTGNIATFQVGDLTDEQIEEIKRFIDFIRSSN
jgi:hypothetical protein